MEKYESIIEVVEIPRRPVIMTSLQYWKMILMLGGINFLDAMVYSIPAVFYPKEAELKGLSKTEYGFVFGSFELTSFIVCPLIGNYMYKTNPRDVYHFGVILVGTSVTLFGFLDLVNGHIPFLVLSFALRIWEATGSALLFVSSYTMVANRTPGSIATTLATMEVMFGMGFSTGPVLGEAIYILGGFRLPFLVLGGSLFLVGLVTYFCFDSNDEYDVVASTDGSIAKKGILELLQLPVVLLQTFGLITGAISVSFLLAVLEPHLRQFDLPPLAVGLIFFMHGATYALCSPVFGRISDYISEPSYVTLFGSMVMLVGVCLVGPAPFLPIEPLPGLVIAGLILFGVGLGAIYVSSFLKALSEAKDHAFLDPNALVAGMWISCISLGCFIGPSSAGILTDYAGFRNATYFVIGLNTILISLLTSYIIRLKKRQIINSEYESLPNA